MNVSNVFHLMKLKMLAMEIIQTILAICFRFSERNKPKVGVPLILNVL